MRIPFRFRPTLFNTCRFVEEAAIGSDVASSPDAASVIADAAVSSTAGETSGAQPQTEGEQVAGGVTTADGSETVQVVDPLEGVPSLEQLQQEAERGVPYSKALIQLRTELERVQPDAKQFATWKEVLAEQTPEAVKEQLQFQDQFFSPLVKDGAPVFDERGLPRTTAHPFYESLEAKQPGAVMDRFLDMVDYEATNPSTGQKEPLITQFFRDVLGLDANRLEQYQNIDTLIAKTNGSITPEELEEAIPETLDKSHLADRELFKSLPSPLRNDWKHLDDQTKRFYLDDAKERVANRQFREQQQQAQKTADQAERQAFEGRIKDATDQDLAQIREQAFTSLRDNIARKWQPSADDAINQDRYDDVLAPLIQLIDPDLQPMALKRLEREGIKIDAKKFNEDMKALTGARQTYVRAQHYKDGVTEDRALRDYNRLQTQLLAKFDNIAMTRMQRYGYQAQQIAEDKGALLSTASAVRPNINGNSTVGQGGGYIDPRSSQAAMADWEASRGGRAG